MTFRTIAIGVFSFLALLHCFSFTIAQFSWHLNQSFSLNASAGMLLDSTQPDLLFFPFEPQYSDLAELAKNSSDVYSYLCFVSFSPSPPDMARSYSLSICLDSYYITSGQPFKVVAITWTANRGKPISDDNVSLVLHRNGDLILHSGKNQDASWSTGTVNKSDSVVGMELILNLGPNLKLYDTENNSMWQSTDHPTDTLASQQWLTMNQKLVSWASRTDSAEGLYSLAVEPGGLVLYASFPSQVPYWMWIYDFNCPPTGASLLNVSSTFFVPLDPSEQSKGCVQKQPLGSNCTVIDNSNAGSNKSIPSLNMMYRLEAIDYFANAFSSSLPGILTEHQCSDGCLQNCSCLAAFWQAHMQACFHVEQMGSLRVGQNKSYVGFLKVNVLSVEINAGFAFEATPSAKRSSISAGILAAVVISGIVTVLLISCFVIYLFAYRKKQGQEGDEPEATIINDIPGLPTKFSFKELNVITKGFSNKLGQGGFGAVYAGTLSDGTKVAVKQLESMKQGDKEFRSEVAIMAGIHHYNLLQLRGFCAQGTRRLLVYEYMEHGSLDRWLFRRSSSIHTDCDQSNEAMARLPLAWDVRHRIALGTARGLAYLHEDCRERILHLDIKPQNILLDEEFVAKVADFGLSRLMARDMSVVMTTLRGTPGYLAPEWLKDTGSIDVKCDVFSFGMLLLELVSGRKNSDYAVGLPEKVYYPEWAYHQIVRSAQHSCLSIADDLTDAKLGSEKERVQVMATITTAFLCIVDKPERRPSMAQVVKKLESSEHGDGVEAARALQECQQQLIFVLMSQQGSSSSTDHANASSSGPSIMSSSTMNNSHHLHSYVR